MSEIFISYANVDRERIGPIVSLLEGEGWSVWWDRRIPVGKVFDEVIEAAIGGARCVIVVWSKESVKSSWVKTEAAEGAGRNCLVPVLVDDVKIPFEFRRIHAAQLFDWDGSRDAPALAELLAAIRAILETPSSDAGVHESSGSAQGSAATALPMVEVDESPGLSKSGAELTSGEASPSRVTIISDGSAVEVNRLKAGQREVMSPLAEMSAIPVSTGDSAGALETRPQNGARQTSSRAIKLMTILGIVGLTVVLGVLAIKGRRSGAIEQSTSTVQPSPLPTQSGNTNAAQSGAQPTTSPSKATPSPKPSRSPSESRPTALSVRHISRGCLPKMTLITELTAIGGNPDSCGEFSVTGGRLLGDRCRKATWDLSDVSPGRYIASVMLQVGTEFETKSRTVTVTGCE
jgi:hypothetical protein